MSKVLALCAAVVVVAGSAAVSLSDQTCCTGCQSCCTTNCCPNCGCGKFRKVCCPVKDIKTETTFDYTCKCEDFCVPGPSKCVGTKCEPDCSGCPKWVKMMMPTCAKVHTRKVLVKTPVTKEICTVKWVVKTVCCGCGRCCGGCSDGVGEPGAADGAPPAPAQPVVPHHYHSQLPEATAEIQVGHIETTAEAATTAETVSFPSRLFGEVQPAIP